MKLICALVFLYQLLHAVNGKGLTMITRGCIVDYLKRNQLLNVSYTGPIPSSTMCTLVIENVKKNIIDSEINSHDDVDENFKDCAKSVIERQNVSDFLLKNYMYQMEEVVDRESLQKIVDEIFKNSYYLCSPAKLQSDFMEKFPLDTVVIGYENEINRFCLFNLLREKEVIESDFNANFEIDEDDVGHVQCPSNINEEILNEKSEALYLLRPSDFYKNENVWRCAAEERMKIGYVRAYYRFIAYFMSNESEELKVNERKKFEEVLKLANESATNCFKLIFSDEF